RPPAGFTRFPLCSLRICSTRSLRSTLLTAVQLSPRPRTRSATSAATARAAPAAGPSAAAEEVLIPWLSRSLLIASVQPHRAPCKKDGRDDRPPAGRLADPGGRASVARAVLPNCDVPVP